MLFPNLINSFFWPLRLDSRWSGSTLKGELQLRADLRLEFNLSVAGLSTEESQML